MFANAAWRTLQILFFRAGPQDFPFDERLGRWVPVVAVAGNSAFLSVAMPPVLAAVFAVTMVVVMGAYTRTILVARKHVERFQQTFNALLATDLVLKIAVLPAFIALAPKFIELAAHPELIDQPDKFALPAWPALSANLIGYWGLAITSNIYRHAADVSLIVGVLLSLLGIFVLLFATAIASGMLRALAGG